MLHANGDKYDGFEWEKNENNFLKDNGKMIRHMDMECISMRREENMRGSGKMIVKMDMEYKPGLMEKDTKEIIKMALSMDKVNL